MCIQHRLLSSRRSKPLPNRWTHINSIFSIICYTLSMLLAIVSCECESTWDPKYNDTQFNIALSTRNDAWLQPNNCTAILLWVAKTFWLCILENVFNSFSPVNGGSHWFRFNKLNDAVIKRSCTSHLLKKLVCMQKRFAKAKLTSPMQ